MARVETIIVGGGINPGTPFALFGIPYVSQISPPLLSTTDFVFVVPTGSTRGLIVGLTDPDNTATERLRVNGGALIRGTGLGSTQIGKGASAPVGAPDSVVIGTGTISRTNRQIAIGYLADAGGNTGSIAIGNSSIIDPTGTGGVAIAGSIGAVTVASVAIQGSIPTGGSGVCILGSVNSSGGEVVCVGAGATANNFGAIAIGTLCFVNGSGAIGIGTRSGGATTRATGNSCIAIGQATDVSGNNAIGIGIQISATDAGSITIGVNAVSLAAACVIGGSGAPITRVVIGGGDTAAVGNSVLIRLTDAVGTDIAAGSMSLRPGISTGNATPGSLAIVQGTAAGGSGSGAQTLFTPFTLLNSTSASEMIINAGSSTRASQIRWQKQGATKGFIGASGAANGIITGSVANDTCIRADTANILFSTDGGTSACMSLSAAGVAILNTDRGIRFNNQTSAAGAGAGTLLNSPAAGNPTHWLKINIGGTNFAIPCWPG